MAVETNVISGALILKVQTGTDPVTGNPVYANRRYSSIKPDAADQDLYDVGITIADLQQHPLAQVVHEADVEIVPVV